jgi:hypothetical protein
MGDLKGSCESGKNLENVVVQKRDMGSQICIWRLAVWSSDNLIGRSATNKMIPKRPGVSAQSDLSCVSISVAANGSSHGISPVAQARRAADAGLGTLAVNQTTGSSVTASTADR